MSQIKWIKITTDMFEDEKIDFIDSLPDKDTILILWVKLLTLAGKINDRGLIYLTPDIPYTEEMLSHKFKRPLNTVKLAIETFKRLGMIFITDDGHTAIINWEKHQNIEKMQLIREQTKKRVKEYRFKQEKKVIECNALHNLDVTQETQITQETQEKIKNATKENFKKQAKSRGFEKCNALCNADVTQQNKNKNKNKENTSSKVFDDDALNFSELLFSEILKNNPHSRLHACKNGDKEKITQRWARDIDLLIRIDGQEPSTVEEVIRWCQQDGFWRANILSGKKLREKWDTLVAQMNRNKGVSTPKANKSEPARDAAGRELQRFE